MSSEIKIENFEHYAGDSKGVVELSEYLEINDFSKKAQENLLELKDLIAKTNNYLFNFSQVKDLALARNWKSTLVMVDDLALSCNLTDTPTDYCIQKIDLFKKFTLESNLNNENKKLIVSILNQEMSRYEHFLTMKHTYRAQGELLLTMLRDELRERSIIKKTPLLNSQNEAQAIKSTEKKFIEQLIKFNAVEKVTIVYTMFFLFLISIITYLVFRFFRKKVLREFYSELFKVFKKNKTSTRIFGQISTKNWRKVLRLRKEILKFLANTHGEYALSSIKFKNNLNNLSVELYFLESTFFEGILKNDQFNDFAGSFSHFKEWLTLNNGKLLIECRFDGEDNQPLSSKIIIQI